MIEDIQIKALNPDDDSEVRQLTKLFERTYQSTFPASAVYTPKFWKAHAGIRFLSLVAIHRRKIIAHIAVRPDRVNRSSVQTPTVQICLPACDPDCHDQYTSLNNEFVRVVERQSARQGWKMLHFFVVENLPDMQFFSEKILHTREVAIWPNGVVLPSELVSPDKSASREHVVVTQRLLDSSLSRQNIGENVQTLFTPERHRKVVSWLYESLGVRRSFVSERDILKSKSRVATMAADRRAVETHAYRQIGTALTSIEPSLLRSDRETIRDLQNHPSVFHGVLINMSDAKTPSFCSKLEEEGFRFCGVLPLHRNKHNIVYFRDQTDSSTERSGDFSLGQSPSILARYIESYSFQDVVPFAPNTSLDTLGGAAANDR